MMMISDERIYLFIFKLKIVCCCLLLLSLMIQIVDNFSGSRSFSIGNNYCLVVWILWVLFFPPKFGNTLFSGSQNLDFKRKKKWNSKILKNDKSKKNFSYADFLKYVFLPTAPTAAAAKLSIFITQFVVVVVEYSWFKKKILEFFLVPSHISKKKKSLIGLRLGGWIGKKFP